ncbi:MAG: preprotein translocase subunit SecG [bacterium]|nr:preprotein translocase subunit SecG [bacterium]
MNIQTTLQIAQLITSVLIIAVVSIQGKGAGLSSTFGGSAKYSTRRGAEKLVFSSTIVLAMIFTSLSLVSLFV